MLLIEFYRFTLAVNDIARLTFEAGLAVGAGFGFVFWHLYCLTQRLGGYAVLSFRYPVSVTFGVQLSTLGRWIPDRSVRE